MWALKHDFKGINHIKIILYTVIISSRISKKGCYIKIILLYLAQKFFINLER